MMKTIRVEYFAVLREHVGMAQEDVQTGADTAEHLYAELSARHRFPTLQTVKVAVNDEFAAWSTELSDGDAVVFIPPVAGG